MIYCIFCGSETEIEKPIIRENQNCHKYWEKNNGL